MLEGAEGLSPQLAVGGALFPHPEPPQPREMIGYVPRPSLCRCSPFKFHEPAGRLNELPNEPHS